MSHADAPDLPSLSVDPQLVQAALGSIAQLGAAPDKPSVVRLLKRATRRMGLDAALFTSFVRDDATLVSYRDLAACDPAWATRYVHHQWCLHDPWVRYALHHTEPVLATELPALGERERFVADAAMQAGFASALIVPAPSAAAQSRVGVLYLGSVHVGFFAEQHNAPLRCLARALAMELGDWMHRQLRRELLTRAHITEADLLLLWHEQQGHSSKTIAAALQIEPKTVDSRFHRLNRKLGTPNRRASVRLAEIYGLI